MSLDASVIQERRGTFFSDSMKNSRQLELWEKVYKRIMGHIASYLKLP